MANGDIHIPTFVNYDCECCGWCCRQYDITLSEAEHHRLKQLDWPELEPELAGRKLWEPLQDRNSPDTWRLCHRPDGQGCHFLSAENHCLMHAHVGELGKPIGCCVFPFTFAQTPTGVYVGTRFSCLAVAHGRGQPVIHREGFLRKQLALVEKGGNLSVYPDVVKFTDKRTLPWADYLRLEETLIGILLRDDIAILRRIFILFKFVEILRNAKVENVRGRRFVEFLHSLEMGLVAEGCEDDLPGQLKGINKILFRQFCFLSQQRAGGAYREYGVCKKISYRLRNLKRSIQYAFALGSPVLDEYPGPFPLRGIQDVRVPALDPDAETALSRFLAAKMYGKQYFGKLFFGYSLFDGLNFLLLSVGAIMWHARALALARGNNAVESEDIIESIRYLDFSYGFSAGPGLAIERWRIKMLSRDDIAMRAVVSEF
jgi:Fe-S-cluster containining protein